MIGAGISAAGSAAYSYVVSGGPASAPGASSSRTAPGSLPASQNGPAVYSDVTDGGVRTITMPMEFLGAGATAGNVATAKDAIETTWTRSYTSDDGSANVTLIVRVNITSIGDRNYMYMGVPGVDSPPGMAVGSTGNWPIGERTGWVTTTRVETIGFYAAHEIGHLFGLGDRYSGGAPYSGYERNIMGAFEFWQIARPRYKDITCIGSRTGGTCN